MRKEGDAVHTVWHCGTPAPPHFNGISLKLHAQICTIQIKKKKAQICAKYNIKIRTRK